MMKMKSVKWSVLSASILLSVGCGGGGSDGDNITVEPGASTGNKSGLKMKYSPEDFDKLDLNESNVEEVATEVSQVMGYFIDNFKDFSESGDSVFKDTNFVASNKNSEACDTGGSVSIDMNAPSKLSDNFNRVWGEGDRFSTAFTQCGEKINNLSLSVDGFSGIVVHEGMASEYDILANPTKVTKTYTKFGIYDVVEQFSYKDGIVEEDVTDISHKVVSSEMSVLETGNRNDVEFTAKNLDIEILDDPGSNQWADSFKFNSNDIMKLDLGNNEIDVEVTIIEPIVENRWLSYSPNSGKLEIKSIKGSIIVTYYNGYFEYELDEESDGDYEISGIVEDSIY